MWIPHAFSLLGKILQIFIDAIGDTWIGLVLGIAFGSSVVVDVLLQKKRSEGWKAMLNHWRQEHRSAMKFAIWAALVIYGPVAAWSVGKAIYEDHNYFVGFAKGQWKALKTDGVTLQTDKDECTSVTGGLREKIAGLGGKSTALEAQNRDQQGEINNCQTQAIKLLEPKPLHWKALALEMPDANPSNPAIQRTRWLLVTNKVQTPAEFSFACSLPIISAETKVVGSVADSRSVPLGNMGAGRWGTKVFSPAWGPDSPVLIITTLSNPTGEHAECSFKLE